MSKTQKMLLQMLYELGQKVMSWSIVISVLAYVSQGKILPADVWTALLPLAVVAGAIWWWAVGRLPD